MDAELKELKSVLRSLVVSSPSQVDLCSLMRDYRRMMGAPIPLAKYGYKEPVPFLRERCSDCFILHGASNNPTLTLIVPDTLKHIDKFVQSQKSNASVKFKGKRRSVPGTITQPPDTAQGADLIVNTFNKLSLNQGNKQSSDMKEDVTVNNNQAREPQKMGAARSHYQIQSSPPLENKKVDSSHNNKSHTRSHQQISNYTKDNTVRAVSKSPEVNVKKELRAIRKSPEDSRKEVQKDLSRGDTSDNAVHNFLKKRMSLYNSSNCLDAASSINGKSSLDDDSGRQTSSSNSIKKSIALEELKQEVIELVASHPEGVWCTDLLRLYRESHGRELNFGRFGFTSIISLVCTLDARLSVSRPDDTGDWLLRPPGPAPPPGPPRPLLQRTRQRPYRSSTLNCNVDPDDALPGIDFDPDVFPVDCMHFMESIPAPSLRGVERGALLDVMVGEVYSPSHFWLLRLGELYHIAMEQIMDDMTEYYNSEEGRSRVLAQGAVRAGHYCSSLYDRDWHRSLIVNVIDSETVKVRHVDYGTVDVVPTRGLKPLLRKWGQLPAQAVRARLAGVRPGAAGRRWPHAASARLLQRVRDRRLVASVVGVDTEEDILEVFLVDTSTEQDECIGTDLIRSGHADPRSDSCVRVSPHVCPHSDSDSDPEPDVRSLLTAISQFHDDTASEVSASASELVGQQAKRLRTWECPDTDDSESESFMDTDFRSLLVGRDSPGENPLMARFINTMQPPGKVENNNGKPTKPEAIESPSPPQSTLLARLRKFNMMENNNNDTASETTDVASPETSVVSQTTSVASLGTQASRRLARLKALHARIPAITSLSNSTLSPTIPTSSPSKPTLSPTNPTLSPTKPTFSPTKPTLSPAKPTSSPKQPSSSSGDSVTTTASSVTSRVLQRRLALAKILKESTD